MGVRAGRLARFQDDKHEQRGRRPLVRGGWQLLVDEAQRHLSCPMSDAVCVPNRPRRLSQRRGWLPNARASLRCVLRRLLLGTDDAVVRGRRNEPALDRSPHVTHFHGEGHFPRAPDCTPCWWDLRRGRCMVVVNGNILTIHGFNSAVQHRHAKLRERACTRSLYATRRGGAANMCPRTIG